MSKATTEQKAQFADELEALLRFFKGGVRDQVYVLRGMQNLIIGKVLDLGNGVSVDSNGAIHIETEVNYDLTLEDLLWLTREYGMSAEKLFRNNKLPESEKRGVHKVHIRLYKPEPLDDPADPRPRVNSSFDDYDRAFDLHHLLALIHFRSELASLGVHGLIARGYPGKVSADCDSLVYPILDLSPLELMLMFGNYPVDPKVWIGQSDLRI